MTPPTLREQPPVLDERGFCRAVSSDGPLLVFEQGLSLAARGHRPRVQMLPGGVHTVDDCAADVGAFVDGIQAARLLTVRDGRPVYLAAVGAAALTTAHGELQRPRVLLSRWQVAVCCSYRDEAWARALPGDLDMQVSDDHYPAGIQAATRAWLTDSREACELAAVTAVDVADGTFVVWDGAVRDLPASPAPRLAGCIKTHDAILLSTECELVYPLRAGQRSPVFRLPGTHRGQPDRVSAYLRLHDPGHRSWDHGLVRLELPETDAAALDEVAALALQHRQTSASTDPRWHIQLAPIRLAEQWLRDELPLPAARTMRTDPDDEFVLPAVLARDGAVLAFCTTTCRETWVMAAHQWGATLTTLPGLDACMTCHLCGLLRPAFICELCQPGIGCPPRWTRTWEAARFAARLRAAGVIDVPDHVWDQLDAHADTHLDGETLAEQFLHTPPAPPP